MATCTPGWAPRVWATGWALGSLAALAALSLWILEQSPGRHLAVAGGDGLHRPHVRPPSPLRRRPGADPDGGAVPRSAPGRDARPGGCSASGCWPRCGRSAWRRRRSSAGLALGRHLQIREDHRLARSTGVLDRPGRAPGHRLGAGRMTDRTLDRLSELRRPGRRGRRLVVAGDALRRAPPRCSMAAYAWLAIDHGRLALWSAQIHENGRLSLGETVFYFGHFLREAPVDLALALFLAAAFAGARARAWRAARHSSGHASLDGVCRRGAARRPRVRVRRGTARTRTRRWPICCSTARATRSASTARTGTITG